MSHIITEQNQTVDQRHQKKSRLMRQLKTQMPQYEGILVFFDRVLKERETYRSEFCKFLDPIVGGDPAQYESRLKKGIPLLDRNDIRFDNKIMAGHLGRLVKILKSGSPNKSAGSSDTFRQMKNLHLKTFFDKNPFSGEAPLSGLFSSPVSGDLMNFLVSEMIHPVLSIYAEKIKDRIDFSQWNQGYCPVCGEFPEMAALSGDSGKRTLISLACGTEWQYSRVKCPFCENENQQQLSYFFIENDEQYRIETCDQCGQYIKTIDLRKKTPPVDYEIENIITIHLDMIAREKGYSNAGPFRETQPPNPSMTQVYH